MVRPRKPNPNPLLDFRSIRDDAWYTVEKLVLNRCNNTLTVRFNDFGADDDEVFDVEDFKTDEELDVFINRFRPACVQYQDEECKNLRRSTVVCALLEEGEENHKFYNGSVESVHREPHTIKGGEDICSCAFVVGWLEGPKKGETLQMRLERICKIPEGSPLFDHALLCFVNLSRTHLDLISDGEHLPVKKRRCNSLTMKSSRAKSSATSTHSKNEEATLAEKSSKGKIVKNLEAIVNKPPEILDSVESADDYYILIQNLEKDLDPLMIMSFLFNYATVICQAFVFPSLPSDSSTRGIIVIETKERLTKLMKYLHNPDQLIVSCRGRPWVISEPRKGVFGSLWSKVEVLKGSGLRVVTKGTSEFKKGKKLLEIFTKSVIRIQESVISEEENVLLGYDTRSTKKLKGAAEYKRIKSQ